MKKRVMTAACSAMLLGSGLVAGSEGAQARTSAYPALSELQAQKSPASASPSDRRHSRSASKAFESAGRSLGGSSGLASWYGPGFHGRRTASGERFNSGDYTAAHRTLPFGTRVKVTNRSNGRTVVVRINDRGPFGHGRIIDLSQASARAIGMGGTTAVALQPI